VRLSGKDDFGRNLVTAKERDLGPLVKEGADSLDLDGGQLVALGRSLNEAWFFGARAGHTQALARMAKRQAGPVPIDLDQIEAEFKALMEEAADALNLSVDQTLRMWDFLTRAWVAGAKSCQAELNACVIELNSDVAQEALQWLQDEEEE
jgi:hypothetical protein